MSFAQTSMVSHQDQMHSNMRVLENITKKLSSEKNIQKFDELVVNQNHVLSRSLQLQHEMENDRKKSAKECLAKDDRSPEGIYVCFDVESHAQTEFNMLVFLIEQVINRQNFILSEIGIAE